VIPIRYDSAADFAAGAAEVSIENDIFFIDPTGRRLDGKAQVFADPAKDGTDEFVRGQAAAEAGNFSAAFAAYQQAAAKGKIDAMEALGELYENGQGTPKDRAKAIEWYALAGEHGDGISAARAATLRTLPPEKPQTPAEQIAALQPLAASGNADAQLRLALLLGPTDKTAAIGWLQKSATGGNLEAKLRYAFMLVQGKEVPGDAAQGYKLLGEAADAGLGLAQFEYGRALVVGNPAVPANPARGITYLQKAATQKVPEAAATLGEIYERGVGTAVNLKESLTWYQLAVAYGYAQARASVDRVQLIMSGKMSPSPTK
jgi:TPR repeat protein